MTRRPPREPDAPSGARQRASLHGTKGASHALHRSDRRSEWTEYESASELWRCNRQVDFNLPHLYDPDQLEDLVTAMESRGYNIIETEAGWLVKEA